MSSIIRMGSARSLALLALLALLSQVESKHHRVDYDAADLKGDYEKDTKDPLIDDRDVKTKAANADWNKFKSSPLFLEPDEDGVTSVPLPQLEFEYRAGRENIALFKEIFADAIGHRNDLFSAARLITKWGLKLIGRMIQNRRDEMKINPRYDPKPSFFLRLADALTKIEENSAKIKKQKGYDRRSVDIKNFEKRTMEIIDYAGRVLELSPVGVFLKWDKMKIFSDDPKHPLHKMDTIEEASDLFAQFRGIGYESAAFMARRIVDVLKAFSKNKIPDARRLLGWHHG